MSLYDSYETDAQSEVEGVWQLFAGGFSLRIARAGGSNTNYVKAIAERAEIFKNTDRAEIVKSGAMAEVYVEGIVTGIEDPNGEFVTRKGKAIELGSEEMVQAFKDLPELLLEAQGYANDRRWFKVISEESTAKK